MRSRQNRRLVRRPWVRLAAVLSAFLASTIVAPGAVEVNAAPESAAGVRIRRDVRDLSPVEKQLFVDAIKDLKAAPHRGDGSLASNRYDEFAQMHMLYRLHSTSGFLPWHRKLLWEFETEVRQLDPVKYADFTVPYWDFTRTPFPSDLAVLGDGQFMGPDGDPNASHVVTNGPFRAGTWTTLDPGADSGTHDLSRAFIPDLFAATSGEVGAVKVLRAVTAADFRTMADGVEVPLHNFVHNAIGGQVKTIHGAVDDPVFWLLHSYVDLLWAEWQAGVGPISAYTQFFGGPGLDDTLLGFGNSADQVDIGFDSTVYNTISDQLDPRSGAALGYSYLYNGGLIFSPVTASPVVTPSPADFFGWNTTPVTITWNWTDRGGSGLNVSTCAATSTVSAEGTTNARATCSDNAGNLGAASQTVKIDTVPPTISVALSPPPLPNGAYPGDITVHFTCADTGSGLAPFACPRDVVMRGTGIVATPVGVVVDGAGNESVTLSQNVTIVRSQTVSFTSVPPNPAATGGSYSPTATSSVGLPVTIAVDATSSAVCSITAGVVSFSGPGTCTLNADQPGVPGLPAATQVQQSFTVGSRDTTPPAASAVAMPTPNAAGWNASTPVTITWNWTDTGGSGTNTSMCAATSTVVPEGTTTAGATCSDIAGNLGVASETVKIDTVRPTISATLSPAPLPNGSYPGDVTAHFTCSDVGSGLAPDACPADAVMVGTGFQPTPVRAVVDIAGNPGFSMSQNITIVRSQTVAFTSLVPNPGVVGNTYSPTATSSVGLPVAITVDATSSAACAMTGGLVSFTGRGTCTLNADQAGVPGLPAATRVQQTVVVGEPPLFVLANPPVTATVGQTYSYTFSANGTPAPTFALATGAPSWLSITPATGVLTGTPPPGTTSFIYSVTASNVVGSISVGPFTVAITRTANRADLKLTLVCPSSARRGVAVTCTVSVVNGGPVTATSVMTAFALPEDARSVTATDGFTRLRNILTWRTPSLANAQSVTFTITYKPNQTGRHRVGAATISATPDPAATNNSMTITQTVTR